MAVGEVSNSPTVGLEDYPRFRFTFVVDFLVETLPCLPVRVVVVFWAFTFPLRPLTVVLLVVLVPPRAFTLVTVRVCTTVE